MAEKKATTNRFKKSLEIIEQQEEKPLQNQLTLHSKEEENIPTPEKMSPEFLSKLEKLFYNQNIDNLLDNIQKEPTKKVGVQKSIYLSIEVGEALTQAAKQKGLSESKLIDSILRQVLLSK